MVLAAMMVFAISIVTVVAYSSSAERAAKRSTAKDEAYHLAEAGLAEAMSIVGNASDPTVTNLLPSTVRNFNGGTATYSGTYDGSTATWSITSTGQVANPSSPGAAGSSARSRRRQRFSRSSGSDGSRMGSLLPGRREHVPEHRHGDDHGQRDERGRPLPAEHRGDRRHFLRGRGRRQRDTVRLVHGVSDAARRHRRGLDELHPGDDE